jgi:hypothetical protein
VHKSLLGKSITFLGFLSNFENLFDISIYVKHKMWEDFPYPKSGSIDFKHQQSSTHIFPCRSQRMHSFGDMISDFSPLSH